MTAHFPFVKKSELGYDPAQVDALIALARQHFADPASHVVTSAALRNSQFSLVKGGYSIPAVDAALDRLDDAFGVQEAQKQIAMTGQHGLETKVEHLIQLLRGRVERKSGKKFKRVKPFLRGYSPREVDRFLNDVGGSLQAGMTGADRTARILQLRSVEFSTKWGGYAEEQVDAFIDRCVELAQYQALL